MYGIDFDYYELVYINADGEVFYYWSDYWNYYDGVYYYDEFYLYYLDYYSYDSGYYTPIDYGSYSWYY